MDTPVPVHSAESTEDAPRFPALAIIIVIVVTLALVAFMSLLMYRAGMQKDNYYQNLMDRSKAEQAQPVDPGS